MRAILTSTADKIPDSSSDPQLDHALGSYDASGHSQWFGYGKVNAFRAVSEAVRRRVDSRPTTVLRQTLEPTLPIPGGSGVRDTAYFAEELSLAALALEVVIEHPSSGDLRLTLTAPSGATVILHDRASGMARDLRRRFDLATTPGLGALVGQPLQGSWTLQVEDLASGGGRWQSWTIIASAYLATQPDEEALTLVDTASSVIPDQQPDGIVRTMRAEVASIIREVQVALDITHSYIGDLLVTLVSPCGTQVVLHARAGQAASNLVTTYSSATTPGLQQLRGEPTQGDWRLLVSDLEVQDVGKLNHWRLKLSYAPLDHAPPPAEGLSVSERASGSLADLTRIKGIGSVVGGRLHQAGILSFRQLAALSPEAIAALLAGLNGISPERIRRQEWITQAERLAAQAPSLAEAEGPQSPLEDTIPLHYETFTYG